MRSYLKFYLLPLIMLLIPFSPEAQKGTGPKFEGIPEGWASIDWEHLPKAKDYPETGGVYLQADYSFVESTWSVKRNYIERFRTVYMVLDERGVPGALVEVYPFDYTFRARLLRQGKVIKEVALDKNRRVAGNDFAEAIPGDIVDSYQEGLRNFMAVFSSTYFISKPHPVITSTIMIKASKNENIIGNYLRLYNTAQKFTFDEAKEAHTLVLRNIPPVPDELFDRPFQEEGVWMEIAYQMTGAERAGTGFLRPEGGAFGTARKWDYITKYPLISIENTKDFQLKGLAERDLRILGVTNPTKDDVKRVYDYVMNVNIKKGFTAEGDLNMFRALLSDMGIHSQLVILRTRNLGPLDKDWPSTVQFNRKIAKVDLNGQELWLDVTYAGCPFGKLPWFDQGAGCFLPASTMGLLAQDFGGNMPLVSSECNNCPKVIPVLDEDTDLIVREILVRKAGSGVEMMLTGTLEGQAAMMARNALLRFRAQGKNYQDVYLNNVMTVSLPGGTEELKWSVENLNDFEKPLVVSTRRTVDEDNLTKITANPFEPFHFCFTEKRRMRDIRFPYKVKDTMRLIIDGPSGLTASLPPIKSADRTTAFASLKTRVQEKAGGVEIEAVIAEKVADIPKASYGEVLQLQSALKDWSKQELMVKSK